MTLETVRIGLAPIDAIRIIRGYDKRGESWSLMGEAEEKNDPPRQLKLDLWVDGCDTPESIILKADGTWTASTHVVLGEKKEG